MSATTKDKLEFVHSMARHTRATVRQCEALMRYAGTLQRLVELECNSRLTIVDEVKRGRLQDKVRAICLEMGKEQWATPVFSSDPRGAVLKIRVPDGFSNSIGDDGICVPS